MTLSIVGHSSYVNTNNTDVTTVVIPKVTGIAAGDFMVAVVSGPYTGSLTWTDPSGWTRVNQANAGAVSLESLIYTKVATGSEPASYTWTCSGAGSMNGGIIAYRGTNGFTHVVSGTNPKVSTGTTTNPQSMPALAMNTTSGRTGYCVSWHAAGGSGLNSTGNAGTEQWDVQATDGTPSTHNRGSAAYTYNTSFSSGSNNSGTQTTLSGAPTSFVAWSWACDDINVATTASTLGGVTGSFAGTLVTGGPLASTLGGVTASAAGQQLNGGPLAATLGGVTGSFAGQRLTGGPIASTLGGVTGSFGGDVKGLKVELLIAGVWTDVTRWVRYEDAINVSNGRQSSGDTLTTAMAHFTLDNREETAGSRFSIRNAVGPYYGQIGRNTQCRITKAETGYRFWGEVSAWTPGADDTDTDRYVKIEASGITRRLGATDAPQAPALVRELATQSPLAWWPCDEQENATSIASALVGGAPIKVTGTSDYASYSKLACSGPMPQIGSATWSSPVIKGINITNGVTLAFLLSIPQSGIASDSNILRMPFTYINSGENLLSSVGLGVIGSNGNLTVNATPLAGSAGAITGSVPLVGTNGVMIYLGIQKFSSTRINFALWYQGEGDATPIQLGSSNWNNASGFSDSSFQSFVFNQDQLTFGTTASVYIGNITVWDGYGPSNAYSFNSVGAFSGEPAGTRFARICDEEGIPATVNNPDNSSLMGPQLPKKTLDLLRECEATDLGIMYEARDSFGLGYIVRRDLYNLPVALELDYSGGDLSSQLQPTFDDKDVENDVTVQRDGGSSARYVVSDNSALSTQDPPNGVGVYSSSVTVSLSDDSQCYKQAGWRAHLGTVDEERVTSVGIAMENPRFANHFAFQEEAYAVRPGSRLTVINPPGWAGDVDQIVQGYSERFDNVTHDITYNTDPASPYSTAVVASTPSSRTAKADSLTSTLAADKNSTTTSLSVAVTGVLWTVKASANFDIIVGGEVMNVTAISGTSSPQTFTVTRSVNSVVKSHSSGEQVRLYKPAIVGL